MRTQSWRTWWCLGKSMDLIPFPWSHPCARTCFQMSRNTWSARRGSCRQFWRIFAFNLLQLCIAGCVQCISIDLVSTSHFRVFSFSFSISAWAVMASNAPKQPRMPITSTFPLVLDEDSRWGLLHRRRSLLWWQRERGLSVKHLGADERFRLALETRSAPPPFEAVGLVDKDYLQFVVNESGLQRKAFVCVNFISIWHMVNWVQELVSRCFAVDLEC